MGADDSPILLRLDGGNWARKFGWTLPMLKKGQVTEVELVNKGLTGVFPTEMMHFTSLLTLNLQGNELTGRIPSEIGSLITLTKLILRQNRFTGGIPLELCELANLKRLDLGKNDLRGIIPPELRNLTELVELHLDDSGLTGSIPDIGGLVNLQLLYLGGNKLTGGIPPTLGQLKCLRELILGANQLEGPIPAELGELSKLEWLSVRDNRLTGSIPPELSRLTNVKVIKVSSNRLTGLIPAALSSIPRLKTLHLQDNRLEGTVPFEFDALSELEDINCTGNSALTGGPTKSLEKNRKAVKRWQKDLTAVRKTAEAARRREKAEVSQREQEEAARRREAEDARQLLEREFQAKHQLETWLVDEARFPQPAAASWAERFQAEHIVTPLALRDVPREHLRQLTRCAPPMPLTLFKLLLTALTRAEAAERAAAVAVAADSAMGRWLASESVGFAPRAAGEWALALAERHLDTPADLAGTEADGDKLQKLLNDARMQPVLQWKVRNGLAARRADADAARQAAEAAAAAALAQEFARQVETARGSDMAQWLQEGGFDLDRAAEIALRMRRAGFTGRRFLQNAKLHHVKASMRDWGMNSIEQSVFITLWESLVAGPIVATSRSRASGLGGSRYGTMILLERQGGQSRVFMAPRAVDGGCIGATSVIVKRLDAPAKTGMFRRERYMLEYLWAQGAARVPRFERDQEGGSGQGDDNYHYIVMEMGGKNLRQIVEGYPEAARSGREWEARVLCWVTEMLRVLHDLHRLGVVWGDLKPENFVASSTGEPGRNGELLGVDFGSCAVEAGSKAAKDLSAHLDITTSLSGANARQQAYTELYVAPEYARCIEVNAECTADAAVDLWALGMTVYWLVTGRDYFALGRPAGDVLKELAGEGFAVDLDRHAGGGGGGDNGGGDSIAEGGGGGGAACDGSAYDGTYARGGGGQKMPQWARKMLLRLLQNESSMRGTADDALRRLETRYSSVTPSKVGRTGIVSLQQRVIDALDGCDGPPALQSLQKRQQDEEMVRMMEKLTRMVHELLRGETECPRLLVLLPADRKLWHAATKWFSTPMRLHFLCAYGHLPNPPCNGGSGFEVNEPTEWVMQHAAVVQAGVLALKLAVGVGMALATSGLSAAVSGVSIGAMLPFDLSLDDAIAGLGDLGNDAAVDGLDAALCAEMGGGGGGGGFGAYGSGFVHNGSSHGSMLSHGSMHGGSVHGSIRSGGGGGGDGGDSGGLRSNSGAPSASSCGALPDTTAGKVQRMREVTGAEYRAVLNYLNAKHEGWSTRLGSLAMEVADADGEAGWVCGRHRRAWKESTPASRLAGDLDRDQVVAAAAAAFATSGAGGNPGAIVAPIVTIGSSRDVNGGGNVGGSGAQRKPSVVASDAGAPPMKKATGGCCCCS